MDLRSWPARMGVAPGDRILLMADVTRLAWNFRKENARFKPQDLIDAFLEQLGPEGTLIVPAFNFDLQPGESYDVQRTPTITGALDNVDGQDRVTGYRNALVNAGIPFDPALVAEGRTHEAAARTVSALELALEASSHAEMLASMFTAALLLEATGHKAEARQAAGAVAEAAAGTAEGLRSEAETVLQRLGAHGSETFDLGPHSTAPLSDPHSQASAEPIEAHMRTLLNQLRASTKVAAPAPT